MMRFHMVRTAALLAACMALGRPAAVCAQDEKSTITVQSGPLTILYNTKLGTFAAKRGQRAFLTEGRLVEKDAAEGTAKAVDVRGPLGNGRAIEVAWCPPRIIRSRLCHKDLRRVATEGFFCYQVLMNTVIDLFRDLWNSIGCIGELLGYVLRFVSVFFRSRTSPAARLTSRDSLPGCRLLLSSSVLGH